MILRTLGQTLAPFSILAIAMSVIQPAWSADPVRTLSGSITSLEAGWAEEVYAIQTTAPIINPAGCPAFDRYATSPSDPARTLYQDILREAFWRNWQVKLLISGNDCVSNTPRIISVFISR